MPAIFFCLKLILSTGCLYGYYYLFLRNKRFHRYNRFYLLTAALVSIIVPFINIPVYFFEGNPHQPLIQTLKVVTANGWEEPVIIYAHQNKWSQLLNIQSGLCVVYLAGLITGSIILLRAFFYIRSLKKQYSFETVDGLNIYETAEPGTPFSFFKSIFWNNKISLNNTDGRQIFRHELFHVKESHSSDVLLMEILCCAGWFNPFFHLIKKELRAIHEFLADEYAASAEDRYEYAELLLSYAIAQKKSGIINPFFHNQIKRRITMITQSNLIRRSGYFSRIMALPLLFILVSAFAVKLTQKQINPSHYYLNKKITVVIDAGHGGIFQGTHNDNTVIPEKNINLSIAKKINELGNEYNINVVLTRNDDKLVGNAGNIKEDLMNRVKVAKDANADLFISIHVNATEQKTTAQSGFEAYISARNEHPKDRQFASAILSSLKDIYSINDTIKQGERGIIVLDKNVCPSVGLECGYINNSKDVAFITDAANQEKIARKILEGIVSYSTAQIPNTVSSDDKQTGTPVAFHEQQYSALAGINADSFWYSAAVSLKNGHEKLSYFRFWGNNHPSDEMEELKKEIAKNYPNYIIDSVTFFKDTIPSHKSAANSNQQITFTKVENEAEYPGGQNAWSAYLFKHLNYPQKAIDKKIMGTVIIQFIVDQDGKVSDVKAISGPKELLAESIRVVKESGNWVSAVQNGKKVRAYKKQPISYKLERQGI